MAQNLHLTDLATTLYKFQNGNILCDTVLIADDCRIWAHSVILAAVSPHICTSFLSITERKAKGRFSMRLAGCSGISVQAVVRFLYTGSLVLPRSFQQPDHFGAILSVCGRMGIDITKLNGASVTFDDLCSYGSSSGVDLESGEEGVFEVLPLGSNFQSDSTVTVVVPNNEERDLPGERNANESEDVTSEQSIKNGETNRDRLDCGNCPVKSETAASEDGADDASEITLDDCKSSEVRQMIKSDFAETTLSQGVRTPIQKGIKLSCVRRSTSIKLATKILQRLTKKNQPTAEDFRKVPTNGNDVSYVEVKPLTTRDSTLMDDNSRLSADLEDVAGESHTCKTCNKTFMSAMILQTHEKLHRPHVCETCGKTYRFRSSLIQHFQVHSEGRPYLCDICGRGFALAVNLRRHTMSRHSNIRPFACRECGRGFVRDYLLREHMESHAGKSLNVCPLCGKSFSHRGNLNRHIRDHNGDKCHVCVVCGKAFNRKSNMEKHVLVHTGRVCSIGQRKHAQRQHACDKCDKVFQTAKLLNKHSSRHSSSTSFICETCGKTFTTTHYLHRHEVVHQEKQFRCDFCCKTFVTENFRSNHIKKYHPDLEKRVLNN